MLFRFTEIFVYTVKVSLDCKEEDNVCLEY